MATQTTTSSQVVTCGSFAIVTFLLWFSVGLVQAGETVIKGKEVGKTTESTWVQIGDDESHGIGTFQTAWLIFLEDGQVGTGTDKGTYESNKGVGTHQGYFVVTYKDGSTQTQKYHGTLEPAGENTSAMQGTFTYIDGTGRFEGIRGEGTYAGMRYSNGMYALDWDAKVTVPD